MRVLAPALTVSTHSVFGRIVTHGTRNQYASFCSPPESVTTAFGARDEREHREVAERLDLLDVVRRGQPELVHRQSRPRMRPGTRSACRTRSSASTMRRSRSGSVFASRWSREHRVRAARLRAARAWRRAGAKSRVASAITSPTTDAAARDALGLELAARRARRASGAAPSGRSTSIRFRSSGIERSKLRSPASTCATGRSPAASAPARVELVSPITSTQSGCSARRAP